MSPFLKGLRIIRVVGGNTAKRFSLASARFILGALGSHGPRTTGSAGRDTQSSVQVAVLRLGTACVVAEMGTTHCGIPTLITRVWCGAALCQLRDTATSLLRRHSRRAARRLNGLLRRSRRASWGCCPVSWVLRSTRRRCLTVSVGVLAHLVEARHRTTPVRGSGCHRDIVLLSGEFQSIAETLCLALPGLGVLEVQ